MITDQQFREQVQSYYHQYGRHDLPWRQALDPYRILVSEVMLQQTQVGRVVPKFRAFMTRFPTMEQLADASLAELLRAWNGLGYNRRAQYLRLAAQRVVANFGGSVPTNLADLTTLPGVGANTAGAIMAYAFDRPVVFIETNIRTAVIHDYFPHGTDIPDSEITSIISRTLPEANYREWYWALMDYGSFLKQSAGNANRASRTYHKQSKFVGSRRQLRGQIIRLLAESPKSSSELARLLPDDRLDSVLTELRGESMIRSQQQRYEL